MHSTSLKQILFDELKTSHRPISVEELVSLAEAHGYKASNAERRLRRETWADMQPIQRLGVDRKPITGSKRIYYYSWKGARTVFRKISDKLQKRAKRKQYA